MGTLANQLVAVARNLRPKSNKEPFDWHKAFEEVFTQGFRRLESADKEIARLESELNNVHQAIERLEYKRFEEAERADRLQEKFDELMHAMDGGST